MYRTKLEVIPVEGNWNVRIEAVLIAKQDLQCNKPLSGQTKTLTICGGEQKKSTVKIKYHQV